MYNVCVPGSHTCSRGLCLWAPVGHVSWTSAGQEGLHMCVNVCPVRGTHTQAHVHTGVVCKCLSCVLSELCALELCMQVGTSGHWTWAGRKRRNRRGAPGRSVCVCDVSENLWLRHQLQVASDVTGTAV